MQTVKRLAAIAIVAICAFVGFASFAGSASAYPPGHNPSITLSHNSGHVHSTVKVFGAHFTPHKHVGLKFHSTPVTLPGVTADGTGHFTTTITIPNVPLGAHLVVATDISGQTASAKFTVTAAGGGGTGGLAGTGVAVIGISSIGGILLLGGGFMLVAARRRKVAV